MTVERRSNWKETSSSGTLCTTNYTIIGLELNSGLHGETPANNRLVRDIAVFLRGKIVCPMWTQTVKHDHSCINLLVWSDRVRSKEHGCYKQLITRINKTNPYFWTPNTSLSTHLFWLVISKLLHKPFDKMSHFKNKAHKNSTVFEYIQTFKHWLLLCAVTLQGRLILWMSLNQILGCLVEVWFVGKRKYDNVIHITLRYSFKILPETIYFREI